MLVVGIDGSDSFHDFESDVKEKAVANLIDYTRQDEIESVAQALLVVISNFLVPELVDGEGKEHKEAHVHDLPHQSSDLLVVLKEMSSLLGVEVADLKQDD